MKDQLRYITLATACEALGGCDKRVLLGFVHSGEIVGFRFYQSGPSKWLIQEKSLMQFIDRKQRESIGLAEFEE